MLLADDCRQVAEGVVLDGEAGLLLKDEEEAQRFAGIPAVVLFPAAVSDCDFPNEVI